MGRFMSDSVNVLMVGTGEYTTGYVHGSAAQSDKREYKQLEPRCTPNEGPIPVECRAASCGTCWVGVLSGVCLLQLANVVEWPWSRSGAAYVAGVFGLLLVSGLQFISLALPGNAKDATRAQP